jgi:cellobiose phosphorylase
LTEYGKFSKNNLEFHVTRPDAPAPWANYLTNGRYHALISHTGGGFSYYVSPKDSRITRWRYNSLPADRPGRYFYLREQDSGGEYWSPAWQPTCRNLDSYLCRHGLNYTRIQSEYRGVESDLTFYVGEDDLEIWRFKFKNKTKKKKKLDLFTSVELCLGHALVDLINQPNDQHFNEVSFDKESEILLASKRYWVKYNGPTVEQANEAWDQNVFLASNLPVKGFDGSRELFIGPWRSESNPIAVEEGRCRNTEITAGDAMGVLQFDLDIPAGKSVDGMILLGVVPKRKGLNGVKELVRKYRVKKTVDGQLKKIKEDWKDYLSHYQTKTPSAEINRMVNVWNQYQVNVTFQCSRNASYYHGGLLFGRGYRDSCQDTFGPLKARNEEVHSRILEMSRYGFKDGSVYHLYFPLTGGGERTGHSDTPLWFPLAVCAYLKETGRFDLLQEKTLYADGGSGTIYEHLLRNVEFVLRNLSPRKLPLFGPGDWNDTLDYVGRKGKGESLMSAGILCYVLREVIDLFKEIGQIGEAETIRFRRQEIVDSINENAWDGRWYIRGSRDDGGVIGSSKNEEGKIFLNAQSWMIIGGVAPKERALLAMDSVREMLDTPKGPKILHPAYTQADPGIGLATRCVPGKKENGAVFNHAASWAILAELLLRRPEIAWDYYQKTLPFNPVISQDRYQVEPYVYAEYVTSPDHPTFGQASHSWLTGSATWMLRNVTEYILGVRPEYHGLQVDPCIPKGWKKFSVTRKFRGAEYRIEFKAPKGRGGVAKKITVDGKPVMGQVLPLTGKGSVAKVQVELVPADEMEMKAPEEKA